jgi:hypothetical protein
LRDEYKGWFGEVLPTPLPEEERPKTDWWRGFKDKE